jgi:membrane protease YdiL (CAAX protease family)
MEATISSEKIGLILRLGLYIFLVIFGLALFAPLLLPVSGYLIAAAGGTFAAAAVANGITIRIFERGGLADLGLNWHVGAGRNFAIGMAAGTASALVLLVGALLTGAARLEATPNQPGSLAAVLFVLTVLVFGAAGEELLFRGYGFQVLLGSAGRIPTVVVSSLLFGWAHAGNQNASELGVINTVGFGVVLGYAFVRSGDLWLPIGIHLGWNWMFPLFGINLSGFTIGVTGYQMRWTVSELWSGGAYGPEASVLTCGIIVVLLIFLRNAKINGQTPPLLARDRSAS